MFGRLVSRFEFVRNGTGLLGMNGPYIGMLSIPIPGNFGGLQAVGIFALYLSREACNYVTRRAAANFAALYDLTYIMKDIDG